MAAALESPGPPPPPASPALDVVRGWLGRHMRVTLTDGRVLVGRLHCLDWQRNILLQDALLWRAPDATAAAAAAAETPAEAAKRALGVVLVGAAHVVRYEIATAEPAQQAAVTPADVAATFAGAIS